MTIEYGKSDTAFDERRDKTGKFTQGLVFPRSATGDGNNYTVAEDDIIVAGDTTSSVQDITLATALVENGRIVIISDEGGNAGTNNITIKTEGSETIDGSATSTISTNDASLRLYCDGTNWISW